MRNSFRSHALIFSVSVHIYLVPGGLSLREGMSVLEECYKSGCLTALDIVEVNLDLVAEEFRRKQVRPLTQFLSVGFFL